MTGNTARGGLGGGILHGSGALRLAAGSSVTGSSAFARGGIFHSAGTVTLEPGTNVTGITPDTCEPDIGT